MAAVRFSYDLLLKKGTAEQKTLTISDEKDKNAIDEESAEKLWFSTDPRWQFEEESEAILNMFCFLNF